LPGINWSFRSIRVPHLFFMNPYRTARKPLLDEVVELVRFDTGDDSCDLPSLAIRPQDRVHVDIRHAAPKLQVCV
jgi:hypothetical protein